MFKDDEVEKLEKRKKTLEDIANKANDLWRDTQMRLVEAEARERKLEKVMCDLNNKLANTTIS